MELTTLWFLLIALFWTGYLMLEGFDFGVGVLMRVVGRDDVDRRVVLNSIGPVWDGNEVWLIVAIGATFAAFPSWYASLLSGLYLPMLVILVALILRGVALEYRGKGDGARWRAWWDRAITWGSALPAFAWGMVLATVVRGVPMDADGLVHASLADVASPYALLGGLTTLTLFVLHGAVFLTLKTGGAVRDRAARAAIWAAVVAVPLTLAFVAWTQTMGGTPWTVLTGVLAVGCLGAVTIPAVRRHPGWSFTATATTIVALTVTLFGTLWPNVLPSTTDPAANLTVTDAASSPYTLTVMSWLAVFAAPLVLAYQGWTYWVFRKRLTRKDFV